MTSLFFICLFVDIRITSAFNADYINEETLRRPRHELALQNASTHPTITRQQMQYDEIYQILLSVASQNTEPKYILSALVIAKSFEALKASKVPDRQFTLTLGRYHQIRALSVHFIPNTLDTPTLFYQLIIVFLDEYAISDLSKFVESSPLLHAWKCVSPPIIKSFVL